MCRKIIFFLIAVIMFLILTIGCNLNSANEFDQDFLNEDNILDDSRCIIGPQLSNTEIIKRIVDYLEHGKINYIQRFLSPDIEWIVNGEVGKTPFAGTYTGKGEVAKYLMAVNRSITISAIVTESITEKATDYVEAYIRLQGYVRFTHKTIDTQFLYTWQFNANHKITNVTVSCISVSLELAFTQGGKGTVISDIYASPEAIALTNSYAQYKPLLLTFPIEVLRSLVQTPNPVPDGAIMEVVDINGIYGEIIRTPDSRTDKIILQFHGGAFFASYAWRYRVFNYIIASEVKIPVLSINFGLAPENPFPEGIEDCLLVYEELLNQYDPEDIIFEGESSGGNMVLAVMLLARENNLPLPGAGIALSPWLDLTNSGETMVTNNDLDTCLSKDYLDRCTNWYIFETPADDPLASPLFGDVTGFPPIYITIGASEVLLSDAMTMFNKLTNKKIPVTIEMSTIIHAWPTTCKGLMDSQRTIARICNFLRDKLDLE